LLRFDYIGNLLQDNLLLQIFPTHTADMPNTTYVHSTGNESTLGLLTKCWSVEADPMLGWESTATGKLPKSETLAVSDAATHCGWKMRVKQENRKRQEKGLKMLL
jgi:hypothetical protein